MPIQKSYHILHKDVEVKKTTLTVMAPLNEEQELFLDTNNNIVIKIGTKDYTIEKSDILCYGDITFEENSTDLDIIKNFNFLDNLSGMKGEVIPANYDYETHTCKSKLKCYQITETWNPLEICKYAHGCLDKPKKIIIFNYYIRK